MAGKVHSTTVWSENTWLYHDSEALDFPYKVGVALVLQATYGQHRNGLLVSGRSWTVKLRKKHGGDITNARMKRC